MTSVNARMAARIACSNPSTRPRASRAARSGPPATLASISGSSSWRTSEIWARSVMSTWLAGQVKGH